MALNAKNDPAIAAIESCSTPDTVWGAVKSRLSHLNVDPDTMISGRSQSPVALEGGNCDIYKATLTKKDGTTMGVAIKRLRMNLNSGPKLGKEFGKEMYIWSKLEDDNVAKLQGFYEENGFPCFLSEWSEEGTVDLYIRKHPDQLKATVLGIARGLAYLHQNMIVHSDLKSANILIDKDGKPKLIDFGTARRIEYSMKVLQTTPGNGRKGTARYTAYELLSFYDNFEDPPGEEIKCSPETDMWSFGMVVYELVSGTVPYHEISGNNLEIKIMKCIRRDKRLPLIPDNLTQTKEKLWYEICQPCWIHEPEDRLTVAKAILCLE